MTHRLELRAISKRYPGTLANDTVSLCVEAGEIHAILGENGAGKSTLMKIIHGALQPDSGEILWEGEKRIIDTPAAARRLGIGMVYQHFSLFETVTVTENIAVALDAPFDLREVARRVTALGERYGLPVDPHRVVHHLSVGERQRVEILRCLMQNPRLLILDEPTSVLTPQAVRRLFEVLRTLAAAGCSILYISHKLDEIRELCHNATILRGGRRVGSAKPAAIDNAELARLTVGTALPVVHRKHKSTPHGSTAREPRLEICRLSAPSGDPFGTSLHEISVQVHAGEIVGIAGISGNGQRELLAQLGEGVTLRPDMLKLDSVPIGALDTAARRARGLAFIPEERLGRGTVAHMTLSNNALLTAHGLSLLRHGFIDRPQTLRLTQRLIEEFGVTCSGPAAMAHRLSGGNLQKFIVGREISLARRVLIASQPTWGVDVAASIFVRQSLIDLRCRGVAVLVISEDLEELFEICDRIAVMYQGRLSQPMACAATNREAIGLLMAGIGMLENAA